MALLVGVVAVRAFHAGTDGCASMHDPDGCASHNPALLPNSEPAFDTVAWLTEQGATSGATISYIHPPEPSLQFAKQEEEATPIAAAGVQLVCASPNPALSSDENCKVMCEGDAQPGLCDHDYCECYDPSVPRDSLIKKAKSLGQKQPSGVPDCPWIAPVGCTSDMPHECMEGAKAGECQAQNWLEQHDECKSSCLHAKLFFFAPRGPSGTIEAWVPGPLLEPAEKGAKEEVPHYEHDACKLVRSPPRAPLEPAPPPSPTHSLTCLQPHPDAHTPTPRRPHTHTRPRLPLQTLEKRGIDVKSLDVSMTSACKKAHHGFVGISFFSPNYKDKAERLLRSCARHDICCKATQAPTSFGPDAPEGSEEYRFQFIASKPAFILGQIKATKLPVVWLDSDLEFHSYPTLFAPGGWEDGPRDVAIFNYWGNESAGSTVPSTGSGVVYFNSTDRAKNLLVAWAEGMAFDTNFRAPDDQVLNDLLGQGSWATRASFGWLPSSYLRVLPMFYRGVVPVIDHDHGNPTGLIEHSSEKPKMPTPGVGAAPVEWKDGLPLPGKCKVDLPGASAEGQEAAGAEAPATQEAPAEAEAAPKAGLTCKATSPQANDEWCNGSCNENPDDGGCTGFCECEPARR